jgi:thioesterase domain-containing protein
VDRNYQEQGRQLQAVLHEEIPLTRHIGIAVESYDGNKLRLCAPLQNNINHKLTAFGGSLYSVAVLCGWGLLYLKMQERGLAGHIVIHESRAHYGLPVSEDIVAACEFESVEQWDKFVRAFERRGRARIQLSIGVRQGADNAFRLDGSYVVHV